MQATQCRSPQKNIFLFAIKKNSACLTKSAERTNSVKRNSSKLETDKTVRTHTHQNSEFQLSAPATYVPTGGGAGTAEDKAAVPLAAAAAAAGMPVATVDVAGEEEEEEEGVSLPLANEHEDSTKNKTDEHRSGNGVSAISILSPFLLPSPGDQELEISYCLCGDGRETAWKWEESQGGKKKRKGVVPLLASITALCWTCRHYLSMAMGFSLVCV